MRTAVLAISLTYLVSGAAADPITQPSQVEPAAPAPADAKPDAKNTEAAAPKKAPAKPVAKPAVAKKPAPKKKVAPKKSTAKSQERKADSAKKKVDASPAKQVTTSAATKSESRSDRWRFEAPKDADQSAAYHYGTMAWPECEAELGKRGIGYVKEAPTLGVVQPIRLTRALRGVLFRTDGNDKTRATSPYEIADCRLVLALDDFAEVLKTHDIVEVRHYSMYRAPDKSWPADKPGIRHNGALAIDAARFKDSTGKELDVDTHFNGAIDDKTCGPDAAPHPATADALKLRAILCDAWAKRIFNVALTPNYNKPHHNHFHLEVTAGVKWFLLH